MFEHLDLSNLFDNEGSYAKEFDMGELTEDRIRRAEENLGYKFSPAYIELLKFKNGGIFDVGDCWAESFYGIGESESSMNGLEEMAENWFEEWEYPHIGIPFADTQSGGHDIYFMDYRNIGPDGEPSIVRIENEDVDDITYYHVADNLVDFIGMILNEEDIDGTRME